MPFIEVTTMIECAGLEAYIQRITAAQIACGAALTDWRRLQGVPDA